MFYILYISYILCIVCVRVSFLKTTVRAYYPSMGVLFRVHVFPALHGMQTRSSDEGSVCLSVRPSVKRVDCDKTKEKPVQIFMPYERSFSLVF